MKRKAIISCVVAIVLLLAGLGAFMLCSGNGKQPETEELPTLEILTAWVNAKNFDGDKVSEALDAYVAPLIGAHVKLTFIEQEQSWLTYNQYAVSEDMPDAFLMFQAGYPRMMYEAGKLMPLDDLLAQYGQNILATITDKTLLRIHTFGDSIYAVPNQLDRATGLCVEYRVDVAERFGLDMSGIRSIQDLTAVYEALRAQTDAYIPVSEVGYTIWDPLSDNLGVLMNLGQSSRVVNLYETDEFREMCELVHLWKEKGFLQSMDSSIVATNVFTRSPEFFSRVRNYNASLKYVDSADANEQMECILLSDVFTHTEHLKRASWGIYAKCEHPDLAMKFLNLMYSDPGVMNLLTYGIEGVHYEFVDREKGVIGFPEGVTLENSGYAQFRSYFYGNEFLTYIWEGYPEDLWAQVKRVNDTALRSIAYGFQYDATPVSREVRQCSTVADRYTSLLLNGIGDVDTLLTQLNTELKAAGIDRIMAEKQRQLDAWLAQMEEKE